MRVIEAIGARPRVGSADLAGELDIDQVRFERKVRQLKGLGPTESEADSISRAP